VSGRIERLYLKPERGGPLRPLAAGEAMLCEAGVGIHGDAHASRLSPRQVLITLASELRELEIVPGALSENIVISSDQPALFRPGAALVTATGVEIRLTMFCEACWRIAHVTTSLRRLLRRRGVLGVIETGGALHLGDAVELVEDRYPALPESAYQRFQDFVLAVPRGRVVRYSDVTIAIGVADSFVRALPGYIKRSAGGALPVHRIVNARGELLNCLPEQAARLQEEGVINHGDTMVDLSRYLWRGEAV
jgi:alkylated DNA nucleotide flippase Atl1